MKIFEVVFNIITILAFILVGTPIKYNCVEFNITIIVVGTIYLIYKYCIRKQNIIIKKIDIIVLLLCLLPIIPYFFNDYSNLEDTLISIVRSISLYSVYILTKDIKITKEKNIINCIFVGSVILLILGIDEMTSKVLLEYMYKINIPYVVNYENRMFSTLGYANSFAIIMAINLFLAIERTKKEKYSGLFFLFLIGLLLSYSRMATFFFIVFYTIYIILKKQERIYYTYISIANIVIAVIYIKLFEFFIIQEQYWIIWVFTFIFTILSIYVAKIIKKYLNKLESIESKTYIKIFSTLIILFIILYFVGIRLYKPLEIFKDGQSNEEIRYNFYNIEPNKLYSLSFDIYASSISDITDNYSIEIIEENKNYDTMKVHNINFNNFKRKKRD